MTTYPLTFPSVKVQSSTFALDFVVSTSASPLTYATQTYLHQGARWRGTFTFRPMTWAESADLRAFLVELQGKYGTFNYGDPDNLVIGNRGSGGTILVNGANQTGDSLVVDGMTANATNVLRKGDYFQLGTGSAARLYQVTADLNADSGGNGVLEFKPRLRSSPLDNQTVLLTPRHGLFKLSDNSAEWASDRSSVTQITIAIEEAIDI